MESNQDSSNKRLIGYLKILWKIARDGFPLAIFSFLVTLPMISLPIFGGHESLLVLDVIALFVATDYTFMNNVNFSCGFAFQGPVAMAVGARDTKLVRTLFQRALVSGSIVYWCITVPILIVSYWALLLIKQPESVALQATVCLIIAAPAEFIWIFSTLIIRTMIAKQLIWPVVGCGAFFAVIGIGCQFVAFWYNTGALGLATAYLFASIIMALLLGILTFAYRSEHELLLEWSRESFRELWATIWFFLKSIAYNFSMRLFIEVGTIFIALLGPNILAAQIILLRYGMVVLMTGMGFWSAAVALMGRAAGAGKRYKFIKTFWVTLIFFGALAFLAFIIMLALRFPLAFWTTTLTSVQTILVNMTPIVGVYSALILIWTGSQSLVLSLGRFNVPTITTIISEIVIGLPLTAALAFLTPFRLLGIYIGLIVSYVLKCCIIGLYYACFWNDLMSTISESSPITSSSETSPFFSKMDQTNSTEMPSSTLDTNTGNRGNTYGTTANTSSTNDGMQIQSEQQSLSLDEHVSRR